ncbi:MAG: non-canonical purine NTP pyrophosphatase [Firmicutes bacterium HGW-Firmicutes-12]|jgi:XTP/dITP diphosphohydrolase|nr:MAG: non-canonical purine NTP pyrophosphatase [Firmicutes bacterium HGW-Firmicutes-12]
MLSKKGEKLRLLMATRNKGKMVELQKNLEKLEIELFSLEDIKDIPILEEKGTTFLENAISKAQTAAKASGLITLADDSGLAVDALDGQPGIYSARFAGVHADDQKNNKKLLQMMKGIPYEKRTAHFISVIAIALPEGRFFSVEGKCEGIILERMRGTEGFGYDPLFYIPEMGKTFAELTLDEKNRISHRGKALKKAAQQLGKFLFL